MIIIGFFFIRESIIFAIRFLCFIAGECHRSVNIADYFKNKYDRVKTIFLGILVF